MAGLGIEGPLPDGGHPEGGVEAVVKVVGKPGGGLRQIILPDHHLVAVEIRDIGSAGGNGRSHGSTLRESCLVSRVSRLERQKRGQRGAVAVLVREARPGSKRSNRKNGKNGNT